jgi:glycine hydroxymethyltransferase
MAGSVLTNKYAEGYPGKILWWMWSSDVVEQIAIDRAKELFGASYANVQPHQDHMLSHALLETRWKILGFDLSHGGHLTHGSPVNFSGRIYTFFLWCRETDVYYDKIQEIATKEQPKLIIAGASAYSRDIDFERFRVIADSVGALQTHLTLPD